MTYDQKAHAVQEMLSGLKMCPECGRAMKKVPMTHDRTGQPLEGWYCNGYVSPHCKGPVYILGDMRLEPGRSIIDTLGQYEQYTAATERDFTWDEATQTWVPDDEC